MHSISRMERQWDAIIESIANRNDYSPFAFGMNIRLQIGDKEQKIVSKRDLCKKLKENGQTMDFDIPYKINYGKLVHHVEHKISFLLSTEDEEDNG